MMMFSQSHTSHFMIPIDLLLVSFWFLFLFIVEGRTTQVRFKATLVINQTIGLCTPRSRRPISYSTLWIIIPTHLTNISRTDNNHKILPKHFFCPLLFNSIPSPSSAICCCFCYFCCPLHPSASEALRVPYLNLASQPTKGIPWPTSSTERPAARRQRERTLC